MCLRGYVLRSYRFVTMVTFKLPQYCYIINIQLWLPYRSHRPCLKENPHSLRKYESKRTSKIPISQLFMNCENVGKQSELILKNPNFQSLSSIGKNWEVKRGQHSGIPIFNLSVNWEENWKDSQKPRFKSSNFESIDELEVMP